MRICVFTGTRAEYGLLQPLIRRIRDNPDCELKLLVTGTHLSPEFGTTVQQIAEQDCIERVEMLLSSDSPVGVAKSFGLGVIGMADTLARLRPDWCVIAGDRYEALACASTCVMLSIPIAHLHGGEISEGSLDEYFRHAITKLSRLHFASTESYAARIIRMGEHPDTVFNVGAIGLDNLGSLELLASHEIEENLGIRLQKRNLLITYHPEHTLGLDELTRKFRAFLDALAGLDDTLLIFTKANADANGRIVNRMLQDFVLANPSRAVLFESLGVQRYFSLMRLVDAVVGNSSSGIIEAPSMGIPTVNVGGRQAGRIRADSVIDCDEAQVGAAVRLCFKPGVREKARKLNNPYGDGHSAERIISILLSARLVGPVKRFHDSKDYI